MSYHRRIVYVVCGSVLIGLGISIMTAGTFGVDTLSVCMIGLSKFLKLPFSYANAIVNITIIGFIYIQKPKVIGMGSIVNAIVIASTIQMCLPIIVKLCNDNAIFNYVALIVGPMSIGIGGAVYVHQNQGTAALECLTIYICDKFKGLTVKNARITLDFVFASIGVFLGGPIGVGTIACILFVGPTISKTSEILKGKKYENNNVSM